MNTFEERFEHYMANHQITTDDCVRLCKFIVGAVREGYKNQEGQKEVYEYLALFFIAGVDSVDKASEVVYGRTKHK